MEEISSLFSSVPTYVLEIQDVQREEDLANKHFRKNKMSPNKESRILKHRLSENYNLIKSTTYGFANMIEEKIETNEKINFDSFEIIKLIGSGSFGSILLVKKKDDGRYFAMKVLKKRNLITKRHLKYALTEVNILRSCEHPFIIKIHFSFQVNIILMNMKK